MPPKKSELKGGLIDPSSLTLNLMKVSNVKMLNNSSETYDPKNYMNTDTSTTGGAKKKSGGKNQGKNQVKKPTKK